MRKLLAAVAFILAATSPAAAELVQFSPAVTLGANTFGGVQTINQSGVATPTLLTGTMLGLVQADGSSPRFEGIGNVATTYTGLRYGGTAASPSDTGASAGIVVIQAFSRANGVNLTTPIGTSAISTVSAQSSSDHSSQYIFQCIPVGSTSLQNCFTDSAVAAVFSGIGDFAGNGAASVAQLILDGTTLTGGSGTTNFPALFIQPNGTAAATTWSTSGTGLGMNLASGFAGNFLDFYVAGAASVFSVSSSGGLVLAGSTITFTNLATDATHTDRTVCQDSTSKSLFFGSGALGICLGTSSRASKISSSIVPIVSDLLRSDKVSILQWRYKNDPSRLHYGPLADDVCAQYPELCARDLKGKVISYDWPSYIYLLLEKDRKEIAALKVANDNLARKVARLESRR